MTQDARVCEVTVVDDVCQVLRADFSEVDPLGRVVAVMVQAGCFFDAFGGAVAGDAAVQRG
ncbi:MAG TPA: hypothetical protein VE733_13575 [Streptosporangiaceae bacterium]|nr:hypothetical protein [Streptosporangiaceae bacterium]